MQFFRRLLLILLVAATLRCPLAWGHSHAELPPGQLAAHLRQFHMPGSVGGNTNGWHWHLLWPIGTGEQFLPTCDSLESFSPSDAARDFTDQLVPSAGCEQIAPASWPRVNRVSHPDLARRQQLTYLRVLALRR